MKPTKLQNRISAMLKENTGTHFLDSGGENGRMWQRNASIDFLKSPQITIDSYRSDEVIVYRNLFWFLNEHLSITNRSEHFNKKLQKVLKTSDDYPMADMENFALENDNGKGYNVSKEIVYTYNFDNILSQNIQYCMFYNEEETFIILQSHNGADARGGMSTPQIFSLEDVDAFLMGFSDVSAYSKTNNYYSDDNGYHWYADDKSNEFKAVVFDGKVFDAHTGEQFQFYSGHSSSEYSEEVLPIFKELERIVQNNYANMTLEKIELLVVELYQDKEYFFNLETLIKELVSEYHSQIESHTLSLKL